MKFNLVAVVLIAGLISSATQAKCEDLAQIEPTRKPQAELSG